MLNAKQVVIFTLSGAVLQLAAPGAMSAGGADTTAKKGKAAQVSAIDGSKVKKLVLTEKAAKRLDIQTGEITNGSGGLITPYSSVVYDSAGGTWVYTVQQPLTYMRQSVVVETISGDKAMLKEGPASGTKVVTVGVAELYGTEKGLGY
jgi:uncharacterized iron-regulated membrane protein